ncbi:transmembrane protein, putative (macronuclear) [Tetrahymena thermophila SB210]|uniref:Transmembrane protein, putative n=1 Tax=Tetrahymena thermophila (strain SB210) TaxID=312017 RepID=I7MLY9_TETTS|nr:transmembrane protein, putative [Tetrahymena thermophila SB210]EAS03644.1 transmembrane protein, putative [Tetrahymena thermophila SB210]|eukprot:XP_001023889.1 transmembrane protein, putative [Tetrahymena thermophila SB210]
MSSADTMQTSKFRKMQQSIHRWLWHNTSNEKSISQSYILEDQTFYLVRQCCFAIALLTWTMSQLDSRHAIITNFQYLTEWGVNLTVVYFALSLRIMKDHKFAEKYWKITHVIFEIVYSAEFIITAMYWGAIYQTIKREKDAYYLTLTSLEHGGMFVLLIIDNIFNRIKFYKRHLIYLISFIIFYLTINLTVTLCFEPVYAIIDWKSKESHIFATVALLSTVFHFVIARIIYELFKKKKVEKTVVADDYFFTDKPFQLTHINKALENKFVWWVLIISVSMMVLSTIITAEY